MDVGPFKDGALQGKDGVRNLRAGFACPQADIGCDLIVAATRRVKSATHILATSGVARFKDLAQSQFDVAMDVFADRYKAMSGSIDFGVDVA